MFLYPDQTGFHFPDLSRFRFLWSPEHILCTCAVLGDGQPSFLWKTNTVFIHVPREQAQQDTNYRYFRNLLTHARILCMHKSLVHAQDFCACTRLLCMPQDVLKTTIISVFLRCSRGTCIKTETGTGQKNGAEIAPGTETSLKPLKHSLFGEY